MMKRIGDWDIEWLKSVALPAFIELISPIMTEALTSALTELQERRAVEQSENTEELETKTVSDLEKLTGQKWGRE